MNPFGAEGADLNLITNSTDWDTHKNDVLGKGNPNQHCQVIILVESKWSFSASTDRFQHFGGIKIAQSLRLDHGFRGAILFVSFLSRKSLTEDHHFEIINAIGHGFSRLPGTASDWENDFIGINPLDLLELKDIQSFYCGSLGIIREELHGLRQRAEKEFASAPEEAFDFLLLKIDRFHSIFGLEGQLQKEAFRGEYHPLTPANFDDAVTFVRSAGEEIFAKYDEEGLKSGSVAKVDFPWEILFLDDEIDEHHDLILRMKERGLKVHCHRTASDAINALEDDFLGSQKIAVVVADYRLKDRIEGVEVHQPIQGYRFLKEVSSGKFPIRLVALSGLPRKFLMQSFREMRVKVEIFSKKDYLNSANTIDQLLDELIEIGQENWQSLISRPNGAGWKALQDTYVTFRKGSDYEENERIISQKARNFSMKVKAGLNPPPIQFIKTAFQPRKKETQEATMERFGNYLLARRVALWLFSQTESGQRRSSEFNKNLTGSITGEDYFPKSDSAYRQVLNTNLVLRLEEFPIGMLVEEKRWFQYDMGYPVFQEIQSVQEVLLEIETEIYSYFAADKDLKQRFNKKAFRETLTYKNAPYFLNVDGGIPRIEVPSDVLVVFQVLNQLVGKNLHDKGKLRTIASKLDIHLLNNSSRIRTIQRLKTFFHSLSFKLKADLREKEHGHRVTLVDDRKTTLGALEKPLNRLWKLILNGDTPTAADFAAHPALQDLFTPAWLVKERWSEGGKSIDAEKKEAFLEDLVKMNKELGTQSSIDHLLRLDDVGFSI